MSEGPGEAAVTRRVTEIDEWLPDPRRCSAARPTVLPGDAPRVAAMRWLSVGSDSVIAPHRQWVRP